MQNLEHAFQFFTIRSFNRENSHSSWRILKWFLQSRFTCASIYTIPPWRLMLAEYGTNACINSALKASAMTLAFLVCTQRRLSVHKYNSPLYFYGHPLVYLGQQRPDFSVNFWLKLLKVTQEPFSVVHWIKVMNYYIEIQSQFGRDQCYLNKDVCKSLIISLGSFIE